MNYATIFVDNSVDQPKNCTNIVNALREDPCANRHLNFHVSAFTDDDRGGSYHISLGRISIWILKGNGLPHGAGREVGSDLPGADPDGAEIPGLGYDLAKTKVLNAMPMHVFFNGFHVRNPCISVVKLSFDIFELDGPYGIHQGVFIPVDGDFLDAHGLIKASHIVLELAGIAHFQSLNMHAQGEIAVDLGMGTLVDLARGAVEAGLGTCQQGINDLLFVGKRADGEDGLGILRKERADAVPGILVVKE